MRHHVPSFVQHLERYLFAMGFAVNKKVLDAGSKDGFGAHLLSYGAQELTLADVNPTFLEHARRGYKYFCPTKFVECDFNQSFPQGEFDLVVAFEIIEHVDNPDTFVEAISKNLSDNGRLIFSVPHMMEHPEHKTLFDRQSIQSLISKHLEMEFFTEHDKHQFTNLPLYKNLVCYLGIARKRVV